MESYWAFTSFATLVFSPSEACSPQAESDVTVCCPFRKQIIIQVHIWKSLIFSLNAVSISFFNLWIWLYDMFSFLLSNLTNDHQIHTHQIHMKSTSIFSQLFIQPMIPIHTHQTHLFFNQACSSSSVSSRSSSSSVFSAVLAWKTCTIVISYSFAFYTHQM